MPEVRTSGPIPPGEDAPLLLLPVVRAPALPDEGDGLREDDDAAAVLVHGALPDDGATDAANDPEPGAPPRDRLRHGMADARHLARPDKTKDRLIPVSTFRVLRIPPGPPPPPQQVAQRPQQLLPHPVQLLDPGRVQRRPPRGDLGRRIRRRLTDVAAEAGQQAPDTRFVFAPVNLQRRLVRLVD